MAKALVKGVHVSAQQRNAKTVAFLIGSMTFGAAVLLALEPPTRGWPAGSLLMAESAPPVEEVRIEYVEAPTLAEDVSYDCLVLPDGACEWHPDGARIRLALVGSPDQALPEAQSRALLAVFGVMTQRHGLDLRRVCLAPASDARLHPDLPAAAHALADLLMRKGIIR
jgi:hypothetical protein